MLKIILNFFFLVNSLQIAFAQNPPGFYENCNQYLDWTVDTIGIESFHKRIAKNHAIILDARAIEEYRISHIENAIWVGYEAFDENKIRKIDKTDTVYIYCSIGYRSEKIGEKLKKLGYQNVYNVYGGIFAWVNNGFEIVNNRGVADTIHGYNLEWSRWISNLLNIKI